MDDQSLRQCLLVHRLEEADASGAELPRNDRRRMTEDAGGAGKSGIRVLLPRRARMILESLSRRRGKPVAPLEIDGLRWLWAGGLLLCALTFGSGIVMNQLSNDSAINILAAPFLGVICGTWCCTP